MGKCEVSYSNLHSHLCILSSLSFPSISFPNNFRKQKGFTGCAFYFPPQTYHVPTRRFYEKEVFKTSDFREILFGNIIKKCCVLYFRDYVKGSLFLMEYFEVSIRYNLLVLIGKPEHIPFEDTYVCESRYYESNPSFQQIKSWKTCVPSSLAKKGEIVPPLIYYDSHLPLHKTVPSVFADQIHTLKSSKKSKTSNNKGNE